MRAFLDLSRATRGFMHASFLLLIGAGIALGSLMSWWHAGWIWTSIALLAALFIAAFPLAVPYFRKIRRVVETEPVDTAELERLLTSKRGLVLAWIETLGILVYREAFESFRFGTAAAIGVLMFATAAVLVLLSIRVLRREFQ